MRPFRKYSLLACLYLAILPWKVNSLIEVFEPRGAKVDSFPDTQYFPPYFNEMEGYMVFADPKDACSALKPPTTFPANFTMSKIVLIIGTSCGGSWIIKMGDKINKAAEAGFDLAVIISDYRPQPAPHSPGRARRHLTGLKIPSTLLPTAYQSKIEKYLYDIHFSFNYKLKLTVIDTSGDVAYPLLFFFVGLPAIFIVFIATYSLVEYIRNYVRRTNRRFNTYQDTNNLFARDENENASADSELATPAENQPILQETPPSDQARTWGTFGKRPHFQDDTDASRPV